MPVRLTLAVLALVTLDSTPGANAQVRHVRSIDGRGNNKQHPEWGAAGIPLLRMYPATYPGDGSGETIFSPPVRPNPRTVSNRLSAQEGDVLNDRSLSDFVWQWGQFIDHDIDLTHTTSDAGDASIFLDDPEDPLYPVIPFTRSEFDDVTGTAEYPRQQINSITAYLDASMVYGSDEATAADLREFDGGRLKTSAGGLLLPVDEASGMFLAGDVRANEQVGLTAMHTLFVREHNRLAARIAEELEDLDDEQIYQMARKIVGAEIQVITYSEFLPALLGSYAPSPYGGRKYRKDVNASITNEFSTAAYRFGHSMLSPQLLLVNARGRTVEELALRDAFFHPEFFQEDPGRVELILHGLSRQTAQEIDALLVDDVRNFLFGDPGSGGLDLATLNIQRGRDHGLPDYNSLRFACGLNLVTSFDQITSDPDRQTALSELYDSVDDIDPWVGCLCEERIDRSTSLGPVVSRVLRDQFERLRDGDRHYWLRDRELKQRQIRSIIRVWNVTLSKVIRWNTDLRDLPDDVFRVEDRKKRRRGKRIERADPRRFRPETIE